MATKLACGLQLASVAAAFFNCVSVAEAQPDVGWTIFSDGNMSVHYPGGLFPLQGGKASPPGPVFTTRDGRARLHIFTVRNERDESPERFMNRLFPRELDYDR